MQGKLIRHTERRVSGAFLLTISLVLNFGCAGLPENHGAECAPSGPALASSTLPPSSETRTFFLQVDAAAELCAEVASRPRTDANPDAQNPPLQVSLGGGLQRASSVMSILGGGAIRTTALPAPGSHATVTRLRLPHESFRLIGGQPHLQISVGPSLYSSEIALFPPLDPLPRDTDDGIHVDVSTPEFDCVGQLLGFDDSLLNGGASTERRAVERSYVSLRCETEWRIPGRKETVKLSSRSVSTDRDGAFRARVPAQFFAAPLTLAQSVLVGAEILCDEETLCGYKTTSSPVEAQAAGQLAADGELQVDLLNVLDLAVRGERATRFVPLVGARLISTGTSDPERNDKPFVIHEQIDVLDLEHTQFLVWGLSGQPMRTTFFDGKQYTSVDPITQPCDIDPERQACLQFTGTCNPNRCGEGVRCMEYNLLKPMLDAGYDVWVVDHLLGSADLAHIAAASVQLYQRIADFGGPLNGQQPSINIVPLVPVDTAKFAAELPPRPPAQPWSPVDLMAEYGKHVLDRPPPIVATGPNSGGRKLVVSGYSLGGVIARMALRLWEIRTQLAGITDFAGNALALPEASDVFMEGARSKVALYVSLDAPHQGADVPTTMQAYLFRLEAFIRPFLSEISADKLDQFNNVLTELNATPTRQSVRERVTLKQQDPLLCFNKTKLALGKVEIGLGDCTLQPDGAGILGSLDREFGIEDRVTTTDWEQFAGLWLDRIDVPAPAGRNGMPGSIPAIAVANGAAAFHELDTRKVAKLKWDIRPGFDGNHDIMAREQRPGAQWNNICARLGDVEVNIDDPPLKKIHVDFPMSARFDADGEQIPGSGFPTLITTASALNASGGGAPVWRDAIWQPKSKYHTNIDARMCTFIMYYADAAFGINDNDGDGWPDCDAVEAGVSKPCAAGGRRPGNYRDLRSPGGAQLPLACDVNDNNPRDYPAPLGNY